MIQGVQFTPGSNGALPLALLAMLIEKCCADLLFHNQFYYTKPYQSTPAQAPLLGRAKLCPPYHQVDYTVVLQLRPTRNKPLSPPQNKFLLQIDSQLTLCRNPEREIEREALSTQICALLPQ